ncbi:nuclease [Rhodotorula mucilaginosa]|uniref:Endonuclease n=1 Tax=Rhodotorula mucilaginosa TaxID=5537 RepID=A0A9P6VU78_RHOMI|nr:nuclease [Rhodotorula mucilaginosa]
MSASLLHLALAGASGLALGAVGAVSYTRSKEATPRSSSGGNSPAQGPPLGTTPPPLDQRGHAAHPQQVFTGTLAPSEVRNRVIQGGSIGPVSDLLVRTAYTAAYDRRNRIPAWTAEHLNAASLKSGGGDRQSATFREDPDVPEMFQAKLLDYFRSGYDRGHMVPAADAKQSQQAMSETFLLSNIAPQVGDGFNRHYWAYLEAFCRDLTKSFADVYVFTVPLFLPKRDGRDGKWRVTYEMTGPQGGVPNVAIFSGSNAFSSSSEFRSSYERTAAVPTHFAKVLIASRAPRHPSLALAPSKQTGSAVTTSFADGKEWVQGAFVLPNEAIPDETKLESFVVPVEAVERSAGLSLLPEALKANNVKHLCQAVKCEVVVRRFDDAQKKLGGGKGGQPQLQRRQTM